MVAWSERVAIAPHRRRQGTGRMTTAVAGLIDPWDLLHSLRETED